MVRLRDPADADAKRRLVDFVSPLIYHWARRLGLSQQEAVDFAQDMFVVLFEHLPQFVYDTTRGSFRAWLFTVMKHDVRARKRKARLPVDAGVRLSEIAACDPLPELEREEFNKHLVNRAPRVMQADFEPRTWQAFWELTVQQRSGQETARLLGMTVQAVYKAKSKVLQRLRHELDGMLEQP